jgi:hypothetical protein
MRRKHRGTEMISTQKRRQVRHFDAQRSICELQDRVRRLEQLVAGITGAVYVEDQIPSDERKRAGPKPVHVWSIRSDRDQLVRMLENYWPEIETFCIPRPNPEELKKTFKGIAKVRQGRHELPAKHLLKHLSNLVKFLSGDRFRRDPRQIANAFAGFPRISIWRSLKICQSSPCIDPIGNRSIRSYIRRKHPMLYADFAADYSLVNFAAALRRYRSKDSQLSTYNAATLYNCWNDGTPRFANLELGT